MPWIQDFALGAVPPEIWINMGMELNNGSGEYLLPDDPLVERIYGDISAHHKTLIPHSAEPEIA